MNLVFVLFQCLHIWEFLNRFENPHIVADRRQDPLLPVLSERPVDLDELLWVGTRQHTQTDVHDLQIFAAGGRANLEDF